MEDRPISTRHLQAAIGLTACAMLVTEVAITRVMSVVLHYHFAFAAVSLAMLGLAIPGVWMGLRPARARALPVLLAGAGASLPVSMLALTRLGPLVQDQAAVSMALYGLCALVPFLFLGAAACALLAQAPPGGAGSVYGADLLGGVVGALCSLLLLDGIPAPQLVAAVGVLPMLAWVTLATPRQRVLAWVSTALVAVAGSAAPLFQVSHTKSYVEHQRPLFEDWSSTARVTVLKDNPYTTTPGQTWGWGFGSTHVPGVRTHPELWIEQDGSAGTPIEPLGDEAVFFRDIASDVTMAGHRLLSPAEVCVIGVGGGRDVLAALSLGARKVRAVELNPGMERAFATVLRGKVLDPYHHENVEVVTGEGRSELMRDPRPCNLVQLSLVDSSTATAAGGMALSENFLYTVEALQQYVGHLAPGGALSITRWIAGPQRLESSRLARMAAAALERMGVKNPADHLLALSSGWVCTLLVLRDPLDTALLQRADALAAKEGWSRHWPPHPATVADSPVAHVLVEGTRVFDDAGFDLSVAEDDQPFFFQAVNILRPPARQDDLALSINEHAVAVLRWLVVLLGVLVAGMLLASRWAVRALGAPAANPWSCSVYYACLGVAFMFAQVPLIQRFILLVGHPTRAAAVVIASMLAGAGLGAALSHRVSQRGLPVVLVVAAGLLLGLNAVSPWLMEATLGWPQGARALVTAAAVVPVSIPLGVAFPGGLALYGQRSLPWAWAVNGAAGVLASVAAVCLAMVGGFSLVLDLGAGLYALSALVIRGVKPSPPMETRPTA